MARKKVLLLGASGLVAPYITEGLSQYYDLRLADIKEHPHGRAVERVDISDYEQVRAACGGMDAILNFTVNRNDSVLSWAVNLRGAHNVFAAAVELGIRKVVHTGPQMVYSDYHQDFGIEDPPLRGTTGYYVITKYLSLELCQAYARHHGLQIICFLFNGLAAKPDGPRQRQDFPPFTVVWEDLVEACRLAVELDPVPDGYQWFNLHSYEGHGKYTQDKAARILGYRPQDRVERFFARPT
jgi:nucleoside-diphosphate-sugar epimerase